MSRKDVYIQADKERDDSYTATEMSDNLNRLLSGYEYGDVHRGAFQIWVHPSGEIFGVESDRVLRKDDYSTPSPERWLPRLVRTGEDKEKVAKAYELLSRQKEGTQSLSGSSVDRQPENDRGSRSF